MILNIRPVTKGRPRLGRRRKAYTPARTLEFEAAIADGWQDQHPGELHEGPIGVHVVLGSDYVEVDVWDLEESQRPKYVTGDADNYAKAVLDGLQEHAFHNDKQVHYLIVQLSKQPVEWENDNE